MRNSEAIELLKQTYPLALECEHDHKSPHLEKQADDDRWIEVVVMRCDNCNYPFWSLDKGMLYD